MNQPRITFDVNAPLTPGTTVLEASAGTGKTWAIAALATRALAEGTTTIERLLLITFSRAATAELRSRVRERLRATADALAGKPTLGEDPVAAALGEESADIVEDRIARLRQAFADFDRAAIMTTHEFCHGMLAGLGVLAPASPQSTPAEDLTPLAGAVAQDTWVRQFADAPHGAPFPFGAHPYEEPGALDIARVVAGEIADIVGAGGPGAAGARAEFALTLRAELERRKRAGRLYSFNDQLTRLADALDDPQAGEQARARLAERFPLVLVDEFQDTDPTQWRILERAFAGASTLILIGDPKQAIYGFRGGDVHTYARAVHSADTVKTLSVNYRSDPEVVAGVTALFNGVALGSGIVAPPLRAHRESALVGDPATPWAHGVHLRALDYERTVAPWVAHNAITRDLVGVIADLTAPNSPLTRDGEPLHRHEIAVLVRSNRRGHAVASALAAAGIPATFPGSDSVFATPAAEDWITLLRALDQPRRPHLTRAYLTDFVGATVTDLALADGDETSRWPLLIHTWARILERSGVWALWAAIEADTGIGARLLARTDGERTLTDHRHLVELLHGQERRGQTRHARDLATWLRSQRDQGAGSGAVRRLDTDADAVHVMTIHRSKGLQWPVVLLPESGHQFRPKADKGRVLVLPSDDGTGRIVDVAGLRSPGRSDRWQRWLIEDGDEALRSLYVGFTRAQSRVVAWWAPHWETEASPLHRLLQAPHDSEQPQRPALTYPLRSVPGESSPAALPWLDASPIACVTVPPDRTPPAPAAGATPSAPAASLTVRAWDRVVDQTWRRTSYSGLTASAHQAEAGEHAFVDDESDGGDPQGPDPRPTSGDPGWQQPSPLAALPAGAAFGTLVHAIYEHTDASQESWRADLAAASAAALQRWPLPDVDAATLASALEPSFTTPLGPLAEQRTLRSFPPSDRLSELDFEYALDHPDATLSDVARLLRTHLPAGDPLADYADRLDHPGLGEQGLQGFLTGSIDSVLRLSDPPVSTLGGHGFLIVDYKTNRLAPPDEELTLGHYRPGAVAAAMMDSHYPLQALLYCVALHRFLRLRLAGYDPDRHLAGVLYLFVRGMAGPATPSVAGVPLGVFSWRPPTALVLALSRLLAGGDA